MPIKTANKTAPETDYERQLRKEKQFLDWDIDNMETQIAFARCLVSTLEGIRDRMVETRDRLTQCAAVGSVRDSWMLPPPARREER